MDSHIIKKSTLSEFHFLFYSGVSLRNYQLSSPCTMMYTRVSIVHVPRDKTMKNPNIDLAQAY